MKPLRVDQLPVRIPVREESDVVVARRHVRELARREGLPEHGTEALATAVTEIVRNVVVHAGSTGEVLMGAMQENGRRVVVVVARDGGPGIPNIEQALQDGYSTAQGLGLGLSSAKRLTDEFEIESVVGKGTTVVIKRWVS